MAEREAAPLYDDVADAPPGGRAWFLTTSDGVRIRVAHWPGAGRGTVLLFPGRTEYVEKYGHVIGALVAAGLDVLCPDWRGQGLSDRLADDPLVGHVGRFADYQRDVHALGDLARTLDLPGPQFLLAHSMGGAIALRALIEGLPVAAATFSAPMFALSANAAIRAAFLVAGPLLRGSSMAALRAPGTLAHPAVLARPFEGNDLTTDRAMWDRMVRQINAHPDLGLAGPSLGWVYEALVETRRLRRLALPGLPALFLLGTRERIVDPAAVETAAGRWPGARLVRVPGSEHEVLMDRPDSREMALGETLRFFAAHGGREQGAKTAAAATSA